MTPQPLRIALLAVASLPAAASAQSVSTNLALGEAILLTSADYDVASGELTVRGTLTGLTSPVSQYRVLVQGQSVTPTRSGGDVVWTVDVPLTVATPPAWYPYGGAYADEYWMDKPFIVELTNATGRTVYDRERLWISDERTDDEVTFWDPDDVIPETIGGQLTATGLDALESGWLAAVPWPTEAAYLGDVADLLALEPAQAAAFEVCFPIQDVPEFRDTDAYLAAQAQAAVSYGAYLALVALGDPTARGMCVRRSSFNEWNVCVASASGTYSDASIGGVDDVDLEFGGSGILTYQSLDAPTAFVDVTLHDVSIRWSGGGVRCGVTDPRPEATVDFGGGGIPAGLEGWDECLLLEAGALTANTVIEADTSAKVSSADDSLIDVLAVSAPSFELVDTFVEVGTDTCGQSFISAEIEALLGGFHDPLADALGDAWEPMTAVAPVTTSTPGGSAALDAMLSLWELEPICEASCEDHVERLDVSVGVGAGVGVSLATEDDPVAGDEMGDVKGHAGGGVPTDAAGVDPNGDAFDFSASVSTIALSQILTTQSGERLTFDPADEWSDLAVDPVAYGYASDSAPVWNGTTLGAWNSTFSRLGATEVSFSLTPTIAAWAWMVPDGSFAAGEYPVSVSLPEMSLVISDGAVTWIDAVVDFHDSDLQVDWGADGFAEVTLGDPSLYVTIVESGFASTCPRVAHTNIRSNVPTACERVMEADLAELLRTQIEQRVEAMLSEVPFPQTWDFAGTQAAVSYRETARWQQSQYVTLYASFN